MIEINIDGQKVEVTEGSMVMHAADKADIYIPHFCYHKKLSVAANCRMCLVDVEKAPKPLPACATPVAEGMKIFTKSPRAIGAQRAVMEFLLINHPLDCPICDQGGECELQDLAMGFGRDVPRENEAINEIWIADRDRFSYEGVYSHDRVQRPMIRKGEEWVETDWETALGKAAEGLKSRAAGLGVLASASSTVEELYLAG